MADILIILLVFVVVVAVILTLMFFVYSRLYRKVPQGSALVISTTSKVEANFVGALVIPIVHRAEMMDISVKTIDLDRRGPDGLICKDNIRADITVKFFVRVSESEHDVLKVAKHIGVDRASDQDTLEELFVAKFSEALKTAGKQIDFEELYTDRTEFRDAIIDVIGEDLNGYALEDVAIDYLEQTPLNQLDENNILDAQGIRKITERTAAQHIATNIAARDEEKEIKDKDVETREAILALERQEEEAVATQRREVAEIRARQAAAAAKVEEESRLESETARIDTAKQVAVSEQNRLREEEAAEEGRHLVIKVEREKVIREEQLAQVETEALKTEALKEVEQKKAEIAEISAGRVAKDLEVAEQEEAIKTLEKVEEAKRTKEAAVLTAEGVAESELVQTVKAAEAEKAAADHIAQAKVVDAESDLKVAELNAQGTEREAAATRIAAAAPGLAEVDVRKSDAEALEKEGMAKVSVDKAAADAIRLTGEAEGDAEKARLLAQVEADKAAAEAIELTGVAEGAADTARLLAPVTADKEAAEATRLRGLAEGEAEKARLLGEAEGLTQKAAAMAAMNEAGEDFERFQRELEMTERVKIAAIEAGVDIAEADAKVLAAGLEAADIEIVGGDTMFFDKLISARTEGRRIDVFTEASGEGREKLVEDLAKLLEGFSSDDIKNLGLAMGAAKAGGKFGDLLDGVTKATES